MVGSLHCCLQGSRFKKKCVINAGGKILFGAWLLFLTANLKQNMFYKDLGLYCEKL